MQCALPPLGIATSLGQIGIVGTSLGQIIFIARKSPRPLMSAGDRPLWEDTLRPLRKLELERSQSFSSASRSSSSSRSKNKKFNPKSPEERAQMISKAKERKKKKMKDLADKQRRSAAKFEARLVELELEKKSKEAKKKLKARQRRKDTMERARKIADEKKASLLQKINRRESMSSRSQEQAFLYETLLVMCNEKSISGQARGSSMTKSTENLSQTLSAKEINTDPSAQEANVKHARTRSETLGAKSKNRLGTKEYLVKYKTNIMTLLSTVPESHFSSITSRQIETMGVSPLAAKIIARLIRKLPKGLEAQEEIDGGLTDKLSDNLGLMSDVKHRRSRSVGAKAARKSWKSRGKKKTGRDKTPDRAGWGGVAGTRYMARSATLGAMTSSFTSTRAKSIPRMLGRGDRAATYSNLSDVLKTRRKTDRGVRRSPNSPKGPVAPWEKESRGWKNSLKITKTSEFVAPWTRPPTDPMLSSSKKRISMAARPAERARGIKVYSEKDTKPGPRQEDRGRARASKLPGANRAHVSSSNARGSVLHPTRLTVMPAVCEGRSLHTKKATIPHRSHMSSGAVPQVKSMSYDGGRVTPLSLKGRVTTGEKHKDHNAIYSLGSRDGSGFTPAWWNAKRSE
ncbi:hypothetical protein AAMO2058_000511700 [Amorphochlora amoebiformis]